MEVICNTTIQLGGSMQGTEQIAGFGQLMAEVKSGDTTTDQAAARVEEYVRVEVDRRCARILDLEIGLHPLPLVQQWADDVRRDPAQMAGGMISRLLGEYAMLRRRMLEARDQLEAERTPAPRLSASVQAVEQGLYSVLRGRIWAPEADRPGGG
jgi:hypothetical protein